MLVLECDLGGGRELSRGGEGLGGRATKGIELVRVCLSRLYTQAAASKIRDSLRASNQHSRLEYMYNMIRVKGGYVVVVV
jgi:hypothetical protein